MLLYLGIVWAVLLIAAASVQWLIATAFERSFCRPQESPAKDAPASRPPTAILLSLRGCDPTLPESLSAVLSQTTAEDLVQVVIDHPEDPAWPIAREVQRQHPAGSRLQLQAMEPPSARCGLKCHSLSQAVATLPARIRYVVLVDADVAPPPGWLEDLTQPLADSAIGGVTGAQWFEPPPRAGLGSWLRSSWNGGAIVPTLFFANPWAGSFAMRLADLHSSGLVDRWRTSVVDDGPIREAIGQLGRKIVVARSQIIVNRERCDLRYAITWTTRMLTWSRLYESTYWLSILHAVFSNAVMLGNFVLLGWALAAGSWIAWLALAALLVSGGLCVAAYRSARNCVAYSCQLRGEALPPLGWRRSLAVLLATAPAHLMYGYSCLRAWGLRRIRWRGINYRVQGPHDVERLDYAPYKTGSHQAGHSI